MSGSTKQKQIFLKDYYKGNELCADIVNSETLMCFRILVLRAVNTWKVMYECRTMQRMPGTKT